MIPGQAQQFFEAAAAQVSASGYEIERSLRFNSADTAHLSRTMGTFTDINVGTISFWVKRSALGAGVIAAGWTGSTSYSGSIQFNSTDNALQVGIGGAAAYLFKTNALLRDVSAWYHVVVAWDRSASASDKVKVWINGVAQTSSDTGYQSWTSGDCQIWASNTGNRIGRGDNDRYDNLLNGYLAEYHYVDGQALDESYFGQFDNNNNWNPKEYAGTYGNEGFYLNFSDNSSNAALGTDSSGNNNTWTVNNINAAGSDWDQSETWSSGVTGTVNPSYPATNMFDGDTGLGFATGTTATAGNSITWTPSTAITGVNTLKIGTYANIAFTVNGSSVSAPASIGLEVSIDKATYFPDGILSNITWSYVDGSNYFYITYIKVNDILLVDAGVFDPNAKNIDSLIDSPTNYEADSGNNGGNYATFNSAYRRTSATFSNGNLQLASAAYYRSGVATISLDNGKWYYEAEIITDSDNGYSMVGVTTVPNGLTYPGANTGDDGFGWYSYTGALHPSGGTYSTWAVGDVVSVAYDSVTRNTWIAKNGTWQNSGDPAAGTGSVFTIGGTNTPYFSTANGINGVITANFGQRPFVYTPPTGFKSLCTANLDDPTIADGGTAMDIALYTGNGSTQSVTGLNLASAPDLLWIKSRSNTANHALIDSVRGASLQLSSSASDLEATDANGVTSFDSSGFSLGTATAGYSVNTNSYTYVAWAWDAGTSTGSNTDGTITSQVRANTSVGFSIVSYTGNQTNGATVGHGLNSTPLLLLAKNRDAAESWLTLHQDSSDTWWAAQLNTTTELYDLLTSTSFRAQAWDNTPPTSSVFQLADDNGNWNNTLNNNQDYIVYCFAPVEGYSAFGSYDGNGSSDGPFEFTGMRPKFVLIKRIDDTSSWRIFDTERSSYNVVSNLLQPNLSDGEATGTYIDILSNGFKIRTTNVNYNASGGSYIYAAFAEHPFKTARAR
jgi:hypothetical protein